MAKKHIQASGKKEGQLVDCPATKNCTLKGPDGEPQQHFDINHSRELLESELLATEKKKRELVEVGAPEDEKKIDDLTTYSANLEAELDEHDKADVAKLRYANHMKQKYSNDGSAVGAGKKKEKKESANDDFFTQREKELLDSGGGLSKREQELLDSDGNLSKREQELLNNRGAGFFPKEQEKYDGTQFTRRELDTVAEDVRNGMANLQETGDLGSSALDIAEERMIKDVVYRHTGKEELTQKDWDAIYSLIDNP